MYIANFGKGNYLWPKCLQTNTVATVDSIGVHPFWVRRDREGYIDYAVKNLKTVRMQTPTRWVASRWYGINDAIANTSDDLWIHREKDELWWTTSLAPAVTITLEHSQNVKRDGPQIYELHKPAAKWLNRSMKGDLLLWNALHPKAARFLFTEGTLQRLSADNALYARALIAGDDLSAWHKQSAWKTQAEASKRNAVTTYDSRRKAIWRMVETASLTAAKSNGQQVLRTVKNKHCAFDKPTLESYVDALISDQDGLCAITDIPLQFDGQEDDTDLLCSLDRIDSNGHYEPGNLQVVCKFVNKWKSDGADDNFRRLIALVRAT